MEICLSAQGRDKQKNVVTFPRLSLSPLSCPSILSSFLPFLIPLVFNLPQFLHFFLLLRLCSFPFPPFLPFWHWQTFLLSVSPFSWSWPRCFVLFFTLFNFRDGTVSSFHSSLHHVLSQRWYTRGSFFDYLFLPYFSPRPLILSHDQHGLTSLAPFFSSSTSDFSTVQPRSYYSSSYTYEFSTVQSSLPSFSSSTSDFSTVCSFRHPSFLPSRLSRAAGDKTEPSCKCPRASVIKANAKSPEAMPGRRGAS